MTKHIYFIRHGLSEMNKAGVWSGQSETPLSREGREQAKAAGRLAKNLGIDYIISSPLSRAHDTARIIALEIGYSPEQIEISSLLLERNFGPLEGTPWSPDLNLDGFADIETIDSVVERAKLALEHIMTLPASTILVVSHGTFGRAFRHALSPHIPVGGPDVKRFDNARVIQLA